MRFLYVLITLLLFSANGFSQPDNGKKTVVIPRIKDPEVPVNKIPAKTDTPRFKPMDFSDSVLDKDKPLTFPKEGKKPIQIGQLPDNKQEKFASPYELPKNALPKSEGDGHSKDFRRNQDFGEIRTKGNSIKILLRDYGAIDGDVVKITVNNIVYTQRINLEEYRNSVVIGLVEGFNHFEIEALNEGTSSPNTGEFIYLDDKGEVLKADQWGLSTGFKARLMIIKEK